MKRVFLVVFCFVIALAAGCERHAAPVVEIVTQPPSPTAAPSAAPIKTTAPELSATPQPEPKRASVAVVGDLLCLSAQISAAKTGGGYDFAECFSLIGDKLSAADLTVGNLETLVADGYPYTQANGGSDDTNGDGTAPSDPATDPAADPAAAPSPTKRPSPRINAPESFLDALRGSGFDVLTTANNHMYDYNQDGLIKTLQRLDEFGFAHTGAYAEKSDKKPLVIDVNGIRVGILAYTDILNHHPGKDSAYMIDVYDEDRVNKDIAGAREAGADFVMVFVHWGKEHTHVPNKTQKQIAAQIANAGADIIFGSHPHCTQPFDLIETERGGVPVLYSLGNFVSSMSKPMHKDGVIVSCALEKDCVTEKTALVSLSYTPTYCASSTGAGKYVVYPADVASLSESAVAQTLKQSRERTVEVLAETVAKAE